MSRNLQQNETLPEESPENNGADSPIGRRVGIFVLAKELGRGGMGAVYLAERADGEFKQNVAIKLIKRGMDTDYIIKRFRRERQILAFLEHPNIAQLLDGGTTLEGLPYFVMEYVEGKSLHTFFGENKLNLPERLKLFQEVCAAVDYAHRKNVVHRDLKPSNILVTKNGVPKLLDFGIAKVLDPELVDESTALTATAMRLMTPEYASPEQIRGESVLPASDIYSLGVLLYELVTGSRPYKFPSRAPHEIARIICEAEPISPFSSFNGFSPEVSKQRIGDKGQKIKLSATDLEKIILKSLRKDPAERYQTAKELSEDISRYLNGQPVVAAVYYSTASFASLEKTASATTVKNAAPLIKSIAVLPLKIFNLAPNTGTGDEFLSIGLADAMITRLSGIRTLAVRPTSTVLRYGSADSDPLEAGRELAVEFVIDGRIRIFGSRIRVSLQLLDVARGISIWANQFDENFTDALELEDSISQKVAEAVLPQLTDTERQIIKKRGTDNSPAFEAYLRGRYHWNQFTADSLPKALTAFQTAIELDPNYAMAYVGLADFYIWANIYGITPPETMALAEQAAQRALEIDDQLGEAYAALGLVQSNKRNWTESARLYNRALELSPNYPQAHEWNAALLVGTGSFDAGLKEMARAEELDPLNPRTMTLTAWTSYQARDFNKTIEKANQIIDLDKNYPQGHVQLGNVLEQFGRFDEAVAAVQKTVELMPDAHLPLYGLCYALIGANRRAEARAVLEKMQRLAAQTYVKPYFMAMAHAALGEYGEMFRYFEKALAENDGWLLWLGTEPKLDILRDDPRFIDLLRRANNPLANRQIAKKQALQDREKSVAVLPFELLSKSMGDDTGDEFLGIGLADALITRLSQVQRLIVRPTSSILRFGQETDSFVAGRELKVDFVVDGNIRRVGDRVRVTAQLLNIADTSIQWAERFNENFTDVLELEDSISEKVAVSLLPQLSGDERRRLEKRGTDKPEAYEAYLRGRYHFNTFTADGFGKAIQAYHQAVALDPDYALAYAGIADYYNWLGVYGIIPSYQSFQLAQESAHKAITIDEEISEAHAALGFAVVAGEYDWAQGEKSCRRALELNPNNATAHVWFSLQLFMEARFEEGEYHARRGIELDPLTAYNVYNIGWCLYYARKFEQSIAEQRKTIIDYPLYPLAYYGLAWSLRIIDRGAEALEAARRSVELSDQSPFWYAMLAQTLAAAGERPEAEEILAEMLRNAAEKFISPYQLALLYCLLGDMEKTLENLELSFETKEAWMVWSGVEPVFDRVRETERFQALQRKMNHPASKNLKK